MPDVASRLAERLAQYEAVKSFGPERLGPFPLSDPSPGALRALGDQQQLAALVTGRTTQLGSKISIDLRVHATRTGAVIGTYVEEAPSAEVVDEAVARLASRVVRGVRESLGSPASAAAEAPAPSTARETEPPVASQRRRDAPIEIHSEELEVFQEGGDRRILFRGKVHAAQEGVTLASERLEAFYPQGARQPERLEAAGRVVVEEAARDRRMLCDEATYLRREQRVSCRGHAEMQQGDDRVRGKTIEIELDSGRVRVRGGARVNVRGGAGEKGGV
jgi:lipopolysaccharide transport protein LptA